MPSSLIALVTKAASAAEEVIFVPRDVRERLKIIPAVSRVLLLFPCFIVAISSIEC